MDIALYISRLLARRSQALFYYIPSSSSTVRLRLPLTADPMGRWRANQEEKGKERAMPNEPVCFRCGKRPTELAEYIEMATEEETDPDRYVVENEGTYNRANGHFVCTECYIAIGMPSTESGWIAP